MSETIDGGRMTGAEEMSRRITAWKKAEKELSDAEYTLRRAADVASKARETFIKWIVPTEAKNDEKFSVWCGDVLYTVTKLNGREYAITESAREQGK